MNFWWLFIKFSMTFHQIFDGISSNFANFHQNLSHHFGWCLDKTLWRHFENVGMAFWNDPHKLYLFITWRRHFGDHLSPTFSSSFALTRLLSPVPALMSQFSPSLASKHLFGLSLAFPALFIASIQCNDVRVSFIYMIFLHHYTG